MESALAAPMTPDSVRQSEDQQSTMEALRQSQAQYQASLDAGILGGGDIVKQTVAAIAAGTHQVSLTAPPRASNWQTALKDFIRSEREFEKEARATFLALAIRLERGEEVSADDISLIIDEAKMTVDDLVKTASVAREILQLIATIEDEIADGPLLSDFTQQVSEFWVILRDNEQHIKNLIVQHELNRMQLYSLDRSRHLTSARLRERANEAIRRLAELDAPAFGVSVPQRNRSGPPIATMTAETSLHKSVDWHDTKVKGTISRARELMRISGQAAFPQIERLEPLPDQNAETPTEHDAAIADVALESTEQQTELSELVVDSHDEAPSDVQVVVVDSEPVAQQQTDCIDLPQKPRRSKSRRETLDPDNEPDDPEAMDE
jgi:hypothetical protein